MVIYRGVDGKPGYQQAEDIHDAVAFVEQMRNGEGVEQARIFRLEEVTFEYRPYYRVELSTGAAPAEAFGPAPVPTPVVASSTTRSELLEEAPAPAAALEDAFDMVDSTTTINIDEAEIEAVGPNGARRGLFGR